MTDPKTLPALASQLSPAATEAMMEIDAIMGQLRRSMARRDLGRLALRELGLDLEVADLDIISALEGCDSEAGEATVGFVAERLNVDPSRASRIVADAVDKGIVRRVASQADSRRIALELTDIGRDYGRAIHRYKLTTFARVLGEWSEDDLVTFARLFRRFAGWVAEAKARQG